MGTWSGTPLDVTLAAACEFQIETRPGWESIGLLDAQDRVVDISFDDHNFELHRRDLEIGDDRRTKNAFTSETAVTIQLARHDGTVERRPIQLVPGRPNLIRL